MKWLIAVLLLIPLSYAEQDIMLQARQAHLDYVGSIFSVKMNATISFADEKSIDTSELTTIYAVFNTELDAAMTSETDGQFTVQVQDMKKQAIAFRKETGNILASDKIELQKAVDEEVNNNKDMLEAKNSIATELRQNVVSAVFDAKIDMLNNKIAQKESDGEKAGVEKILLESFQKRKDTVKNIEFKHTKLSESTGILQKAGDVFSSIGRFFTSNTKKIARNDSDE